ncbi:cytochrome-c peroxidase [Crocinitomicaceae bacterium]|nr:cytochrome-c peroxidase [Crocinitomicaceae bacterium]
MGRKLFYDKLLSSDQTISCASCHSQGDAFSDVNQFSTGVGGAQGGRQGMAIFNLAWHNGGFFWDGRATTLREQAVGPIENPLEMNETLANVVSKLNNTSDYPTMFEAAFGDNSITSDRIGLALENFMLTIVSNDSKYDQYLAGNVTLTQSEERGRRLFFGIGQNNMNGPGGGGPQGTVNCAQCHGGANFDSPQYFNIGLDGDGNISDVGREGVTGNPADRAKFKTTSLRNIAVSGPYMHDGRFNTLEQVIQFYNNGVNQSNTLAPQLQASADNGSGLSGQDREYIVNFLNTLTDPTYLNNPDYSDPN